MLKFGMKTLHNRRIRVVLACVVVSAGFLFGFWPLCLMGVMLAAALGRSASALLLGLFLDVVYGVPAGFLHLVYFPFTLFALASVLVQTMIMGRIRTTQTDTL